MKKYVTFFSFIFIFSMLNLPTFAATWPPPAYEMPRTVISEEIAKQAFSGIKTTLGSVSNTGLKIFGIYISVCLISSIFGRLVLDKLRIIKGVRKNEFTRKVNSADRSRNLDSIVDDRVANMEVNLLAKNRFRLRHPNADLDEKIYQRQVSNQANAVMRKRGGK